MREEEKGIVVAIVFGVIEVIFNLFSIINAGYLIMVASTVISFAFIISFLLLLKKYKQSVDNYNFIKFLFFGSKDNGFNFFPKLKIFMDELGDFNEFEVERMRFDFVSYVEQNYSDVSWTMENVYNKSKKAISQYYLYSSNDSGETNEGKMEIKGMDRPLYIDASRIDRRRGVQKTPYTFKEPIKPKEMIRELKIHMKMETTYSSSKPEIIYLYPRNYGTKVNHMEIHYSVKGVKNIVVKLHEVGKKGKVYCDDEIKSGDVITSNDYCECTMYLDKDEICINNLYYLIAKIEK